MCKASTVTVWSSGDPNTHTHTHLANTFWSSLHGPWGAALRGEDTDAIWSTWTWAVEELLLDLHDDGRAEATMRAQWPGPPVMRTSNIEMDTRGRGTTGTLFVTKLCLNKKLPSGAPITRATLADGRRPRVFEAGAATCTAA